MDNGRVTLNFKHTASDYRLMEAVGPALIRAELAKPGDHPLTLAEFRAALRPLIAKLPDVMFWERTRHRASTSHGCYAIQQAFREWSHGRWETHRDLPGDYRSLGEAGL